LKKLFFFPLFLFCSSKLLFPVKGIASLQTLCREYLFKNSRDFLDLEIGLPEIIQREFHSKWFVEFEQTKFYKILLNRCLETKIISRRYGFTLYIPELFTRQKKRSIQSISEMLPNVSLSKLKKWAIPHKEIKGAKKIKNFTVFIPYINWEIDGLRMYYLVDYRITKQFRRYIKSRIPLGQLLLLHAFRRAYEKNEILFLMNDEEKILNGFPPQYKPVVNFLKSYTQHCSFFVRLQEKFKDLDSFHNPDNFFTEYPTRSKSLEN